MPVVGTLILLVLLTIAGCVEAGRGGRGFEDRTATEGELLALVSAAIRAAPHPGAGGDDAIAYADLAAAREQLGLPEDAGFPGPRKRRLLFSFAARPLYGFGTLFGPDPGLGPLGRILDGGRIEVAVGTNFAFSGPLADEVGPGDVVVVRTRQPFGEMADRLRRAGYEEVAGGLLLGGEPIGLNEPRIATSYDGFPFPAVGDAGGGVVVFGGSARAVRAALRGGGAEPTPAAELVAELPGVARLARGEPFGVDCVMAIGLGEEAAPRTGKLVVVVDGQAEADRLLFGGVTYVSGFPASDSQVAFGEATAEGERATVRFSSTDRFNPTRLPIEEVWNPYDCS